MNQHDDAGSSRTPPPVGATPAGPGYPRRGWRWSRALARWLMRLVGWRLEGALPEIPKFVLIGAPHTSNWDFPICMLAMLATGIRVSWLAKAEVFKFPVSRILRWLGGEPIDRRAHHGFVGEAIRHFQERDSWVIGITPEGTRKPVPEWKTGFYRIAVGAGVPIFTISIDYSRRVFGLDSLFHPTGDRVADISALRRRYHKGMARHPENFVEEPDPSLRP